MAALAIVGQHDPYLADMEWLAKTMPRCALEVMERSAHFPFVEEEERFAAVLERFLGEISPG